MPVDPDAIKIDERIAGGELFDGGHMIRQPVVDEVAVIGVVKSLRTKWGTHVVELNDDEPELRQRKVFTATLEPPPTNAPHLGAWIDVADDRICCPRIEVRWEVDHAVQVRQSIPRLDREHLGRPKPDLLESRDVGALELADDAAIRRSQYGDRRGVDAGIGVNEITAAGREPDRVVALLRGEDLQPSPIEADTVQVRVIDVAPWFTTTPGEVDLPGVLVDMHHGAHRPRAGCDPIAWYPAPVEAVEMGPTVLLRPPDHVLPVVRHVPTRRPTTRPSPDLAQFHEGRGRIREDHA